MVESAFATVQAASQQVRGVQVVLYGRLGGQRAIQGRCAPPRLHPVPSPAKQAWDGLMHDLFQQYRGKLQRLQAAELASRRSTSSSGDEGSGAAGGSGGSRPYSAGRPPPDLMLLSCSRLQVRMGWAAGWNMRCVAHPFAGATSFETEACCPHRVGPSSSSPTHQLPGMPPLHPLLRRAWWFFAPAAPRRGRRQLPRLWQWIPRQRAFPCQRCT